MKGKLTKKKEEAGEEEGGGGETEDEEDGEVGEELENRRNIHMKIPFETQ